MRKLTVIIGLLLLTLAAVSLVAAQAPGVPGAGWWSGEQVQNVGDANATVLITAYDSDSNNTYSDSKNVAPGSAYTFTPIGDFSGMPAGFEGSAVVESDQPVKAIVNVTNQQAGNVGVAGGKAAAQYQGTDATAVDTTLYFPLAKGDYYGKTSSFYVQNAGASTISNGVATFTMDSGAVYVYNLPNIGPNKMVVFNIFSVGGYNPASNADRLGSLIVTGGQDMAGVVMEHDTTANPAVVLNGTRGFTQADFDTKAYSPVVKREWFGQFTGIQVQNVSNSPIDVTVNYKGTGGSCNGGSYADSKNNVPAGRSYTFVQYAGSTNLPANCVASATITADGNFVALTNEQELTGFPKVGITYSDMADGSTTTKVSIPLFKDNFYGALTGLQIQNVGNARANDWTATFKCTGGGNFTAISDVNKTGTIPAGGAYLFYTPSDDNLFTASNPFSASAVNCAVTIEADQPIVAIANEAPTAAGALDNNNYEGFNLTP